MLPHCREHNLPFALMPGVRRAVNPQLKLAGDGVGASDLIVLQNLCAGFPENKFMATVLARENQHELCVLARKFRNLHIFGCWWFTNVPHLIDEITRLRVEMLGLSFTPQHSDARVLDQIIYKWQHSRRIIAQVLVEKYSDLAKTGWPVNSAEIERERPGPLRRRIRKVLRMPGLIAIVGRPNVGKSALFNRIVGRRIAIVHDQPGVTRDRISAEAEWHGRPSPWWTPAASACCAAKKPAMSSSRPPSSRCELAIEAANVIILVVNVQEGVVPLDREAAPRLRHSGKPVLVAVNKVDTYRAETARAGIRRAGFRQDIPRQRHSRRRHRAASWMPPWRCCPVVESSETGRRAKPAGTAARRRSALRNPLKLAIVGRPNVGKSSIINALTQSERVIVTPIPGTTRDAVDVPFEVETDGVRQNYMLIDTAGMRKTRRVDDSIEFFSVKRAEESIARCDIADPGPRRRGRHHRAGQKGGGQDRGGPQGLHRGREQMGFGGRGRPPGARGRNRAPPHEGEPARRPTS